MTFEELCYKHGMSYKELIQASGLPRGTIDYLMKGNSDLLSCRGRTLYTLSKVFGMSMEDLMLSVDAVPEKEKEAQTLRKERFERLKVIEDYIREDQGEPPVKRRTQRRFATRESLSPVATKDDVTEKHVKALEGLYELSAVKRSKALRDAIEAAISSLREVTRLREKNGSERPSGAVMDELRKGETDGKV